MSQRNPQNERYNEENKAGKTRKSAASAKPSARKATVHEPAPKSKKQKKEEQRQRDQRREAQARAMGAELSRYEDTPEYKKLRRIWWICIASAIALVAVSFLCSRNEQLGFLYIPLLILGYVLIIVAFYIDLGKIRKMKKQHTANLMMGKSKEARAQQKKARAEARAQEKEAQEKFAEAKAEEEEKKANGFFGRFRKKSTPDSPPQESTPDSPEEKDGDAEK